MTADVGPIPGISESEEDLASRDALQWDVKTGLVPFSSSGIRNTSMRIGRRMNEDNIELNRIVKTVEVSQHASHGKE
jgi:hypothetical protein